VRGCGTACSRVCICRIRPPWLALRWLVGTSAAKRLARRCGSCWAAWYVRVYAPTRTAGIRTTEPQGLAEAAQRVVGLGYTALKFDPFGSAYRDLSGHELSEALNLIAAVREAVGETVDIMIEAHDGFRCRRQ